MEISYYNSPVGILRLEIENEYLVALSICDSTTACTFSQSRSCAMHQTMEWLDAYFGNLKPDPGSVPICLRGTDFQLRVWHLLLQVPYGKSVTYGQLAKRLGEKMSAQAVGQAVGANPIGIIVPCHRVLGAKGKLTGYAAGTDRKKQLLDLEGIPYI